MKQAFQSLKMTRVERDSKGSFKYIGVIKTGESLSVAISELPEVVASAKVMELTKDRSNFVVMTHTFAECKALLDKEFKRRLSVLKQGYFLLSLLKRSDSKFKEAKFT